MPSNMLTVMILLVSFLTNSVDNFLTLLNVNGVNNLLASCLGDLARVLMGMLVALLLPLVFTLRTTVVAILQHQLTSCGSYQHGIHQQPWSRVQQYENGDNETLVLVPLVSYGTVGPSCHDNEDHHAVDTQYVHGHP